MLQKYCQNKLESYSSIKIEQGEKMQLLLHVSIKPNYVAPIYFQVVVPEVKVSEVERLEMIIEDLRQQVGTNWMRANPWQIQHLSPVVGVATAPAVSQQNTYVSVVSAKAPTKGAYLVRVTAWVNFSSSLLYWQIIKGGTVLAPSTSGTYPLGNSGSQGHLYPFHVTVHANLEAGDTVSFNLMNHSSHPIQQVGQCVLELSKLQSWKVQAIWLLVLSRTKLECCMFSLAKRRCSSTYHISWYSK